jgi:ketosteroid isomerase-like protein
MQLAGILFAPTDWHLPADPDCTAPNGTSLNPTPRRCVMNVETSATGTVVRNHLQAFLEQKGVAAIVSDYDEDARFYSEAKVYRGKQEIYGFFTDFISSLPAGAIEHFTLRSLRVDRDIAYITWCVGSDIPLGTDTFVVDDGKIVSQTFAMCAAAA